jgi:hypothetical protein
MTIIKAGADVRGNAVLFSEMTPEPDFADNFHDWYDTEHIPIRMDAPGFVSAQRYRRDDSPGYLAVYELDDLAAMKTPEYGVIKGQPSDRTRWMLANVKGFTRYLCRSLDVAEKPSAPDAVVTAPLLYAVWFNVPEAEQAEFDAWYREDHIPLLMKCEQWLQVRRFAVTDGEPKPYTRLALHYLAGKEALNSPERAAARATPWRKRLADKDWFKGDYAVFHRHGARHKGQRPEL